MCKCIAEKHEELLGVRNTAGEMPLFLAAYLGKKCKVGSAQIMWRPNFLFSLKPIRATCFNIEKEACWLPGDLLFWSSEGAGRFYFSSRK